jgi:hypothetical protein
MNGYVFAALALSFLAGKNQVKTTQEKGTVGGGEK